MLLAVYDTDASANGTKLPKSHVAPYFNCLDLRNAVVLLTTLSASHDGRAGGTGIT